MITILELIVEYTEYLHSLDFTHDTVRQIGEKRRKFSQWQKGTFGVQTVDSVRKDHLKRWHASLSALRTKEGHPLKTVSVNRHIIAVRGFIKYLALNGYVQNNLLNYLPCLKTPKNLPGSVLDHTQMRKLLSGIPTDNTEGYRDRAMFEFLYSTGIRVSELLGLDVDDIDFKHHTAFIRGKGNKDRVVPIGETALSYLNTYVAGVRPYMLTDKNQRALFLGVKGRRLSYIVFRIVLRKIATQSGSNEKITAHTFRRSCTTELVKGEANIYHVKELLGHESLNTLDRYTRLTIIDLKKTHRKCHPRERDSK